MSKKKHKKSSKQWLTEHFDDHYVKKAQEMGYRSRAAFKLIELQEKDRIIRPNDLIVDLGAAPGSWSQVARDWLGKKGQIYALDILPMDNMDGVEVITGDFTKDEVLQQLVQMLGEQQVNVVMSDMAPNMSGMVSVDQPKSMYLADLAIDFAKSHLAKGGIFVSKLFHGEDFDQYIQELRSLFEKVVVRKPKASRPRSKEVYVVAKNKKNQ